MAKRFDIAGLVADKTKNDGTPANTTAKGQQPTQPTASSSSGTATRSSTRARRTTSEPAEKKGGSGPSAPASRRPGKSKPAAPAQPTEPTQDASAAPEPPAEPRSRRGPVDPPEPAGIAGERRINLPLQAELHHALAQARVDDQIEATIRLRAMVELWRHDPRLRARIDRLARKRASTLQRGRPRKDATP